MRLTIATAAAVLFAIPGLLSAEEFEKLKNPGAVQEVRTGKRTSANAAWWGFDEEDATDSLQAAINSGAKSITVPNVGADWIVRPITLAGNQELILEKGVVIAAKRGEFRGKGDCLFTARNVANLTIRGYGATFRMQKEDYIVGLVLTQLNWSRWFGQYAKSEWRNVLALRGCSNVHVYGLTLRDSGGDGIYIDGGLKSGFCRDVELKDVVCDNNYRQGMSVISVDGLTVENCAFKNTWGTPPCSGVDFEPDAATQMLKRINFHRCSFDDNYADGIEIFLPHLEGRSGPVSLRFDSCRISSRRGPGIRVSKIYDNGPAGAIIFSNCVVEGAEGYGIKVQDKSADAARVRFVNCTLRKVARNRGYRDVWAPVAFTLREGGHVKRFGGIDFDDCRIDDDRDRPAVAATIDSGLFDITGTVLVKNPQRANANLTDFKGEVALKVKPLH